MTLADTGFELTVRKLTSLRPHEETIPAHVEQMARQLEDDRVQKDPILIDGKSGTVLDGMHRLAAFARLGLERAVCCSLDYSSDNVTVRRWARVYQAGKRSELEEVFEAEGFIRRIGLEEALEALQKRSVGIVVALGGESRAQTGPSTLEESFKLVERIDRVSSARGWGRSFVPEDEIGEELPKPDRAVMLVQRLRKEDVISAAVERRLFPCKTSMHLVDPRPVAVRYPLSELKGPSGRRPSIPQNGKLLPAGSTYEGRRYKERLLLLNPR